MKQIEEQAVLVRQVNKRKGLSRIVSSKRQWDYETLVLLRLSLSQLFVTQ